MCEEDSVEYLRDLIKEKDNLGEEEDQNLLKKLLSKGKLIISIKVNMLSKLDSYCQIFR